MPDISKKPLRDLEELTDEVVESISEEPEIEPGQADTTPAVPAKGGAKRSNTASKQRSPMAQKPKKS